MSAAVIGALRVNLGLDSAQYTNGLNAAQRQIKAFGAKMQSVGNTMAGIGAGMTLAITGPLIAAGFAASKAAKEAAEAMGQVEAALTSMGDASGKTKAELAGLADGLMRSSLYDDDDILRKVTANLLTFGNVAGEQFDRAQQAAVDLATRMNMDLQPATLLIGKALNDPIKGLTAMGRAGIQFTAQQKEQIKAMAAAGNAAGAQRIILGELERQFGGAAAAAQNTDPYDKLRDSLNTLSESAGGIINRFLVPMMDKLAGLFDRFNALSPEMQKFVVIGAAIAAALGPALVVIGSLVSAVGAIAGAFAAGGILAALAPILPVILAIGAAVAVLVGAFLLFRKDVEPVLKALWEQAVTTLGPPLQELFAVVGELAAQIGAAFKEFIGSEAGQALIAFAAMMSRTMGGVVIQVLKALIQTVTLVLKTISGTFGVLAALLRGDWSEAWRLWRAGVAEMLGSVIGAIARFASAAVSFISGMVNGVSRWLTGKLFDVLKSVIDKVKGVSDAFFRLYDAVVGHSYVPDMVNGIAAWMAKLDAGMVVPARNATDKTREAFETLRDDIASIMEGLLTDQERAARELARQTAAIRRAVADPRQGVSAALGAQLEGGVAAAGMTVGERRTLGPMADGREISQALREGGIAISNAAREIQDKARAAADDFGQRFGDAVEAAINGDIRGAFESIFGDLRSILTEVGRALYQAFNNRGAGESIWSTLGRAVAGAFGGGVPGKGGSGVSGGSKLPGFATGGSFKVGGTGGIDSQVRSIRATPNETISVTKPGQFRDGGATVVHVNPSPYFDVQVEKVAAPLALRSGAQAFGAARTTVPADTARRRRFNLSGA